MQASLKQWRDWSFNSRGRFRGWRRLTPQTLEQVPPGPGVYLLAWPQPQTAPTPRPLGRLLAEDPHGILDIGEAIHLQTRLTRLRDCCAQQGVEGHMAGWRLGTLRLLKRLGVAAEDLLVDWHEVADKDEAYEWEGWLLRTYFQIFGELPPLNYKFNWSAFSEDELGL